MTDKKEIVVDIDANIEDADWPKRTNDVFFDKNHPQAAKPTTRERRRERDQRKPIDKEDVG